MKPIDVKSSTYIDLSVGNNDKDPKFKLFDHERILKYGNIFASGYIANFPEKFSVCYKSWKYCAMGICYQWPYTMKKVLKAFIKKDSKRQYNDNLELKKTKRQQILFNRRVMIIYLVASLKGKLYYKEESMFSWTVWNGDNVKVENAFKVESKYAT